MTAPIYLDHNATTPLDARVLEAVLPYLQGRFGNPSSSHRYGRAARRAVDTARAQVAALVNADPGQVVFTGGGSEANNLALKGVALASGGGRVAVSAVEHSSVLQTARALARRGWGVDSIAVDVCGRVTAESLQAALRNDTLLVSIMFANNETGVVQALPELAAQARSCGALVHTDAVQAAGKIPLNFSTSGAHLMTLSAHKLYGPIGVGALVYDRAVELEPLVHGGGHEWGLRAGTENVAGIVGFGVAAQLAYAELDARRARLLGLRRYLEARLGNIPGITLIAGDADRVPNTLMFSLPGLEGETLLLALDRAGVAVSSGSACSSGVTEPSHVLVAMQVAENVARGAIRVSLGKDNTEADVDGLVTALQTQVGGFASGAVADWS